MEPRFTPGDRLSTYVGDRSGQSQSLNRQRRVGEGPYMGGFESGQRLFAILFRRARKSLEIRHFRPRFRVPAGPAKGAAGGAPARDGANPCRTSLFWRIRMRRRPGGMRQIFTFAR